MHFGHMLTAMVTPFDQQDNVDFKQMEVLIEHLLESGTEGLVITGTTGESPVLSKEEMKEIYKFVVSTVNGRVPVLAGTGCNNTKSSIDLTESAESYGVDGIMLVAPYYNKPNQRGLYEHFKAIANKTSLPVMLYNIPGRSSVHIEAETIIKLSEVNNIIGVKEASGNLDQVATIVANTNDDFYVYSGDDGMTLPMMSVGAIGIVSVAAHIIGKEIQEMIQLFFSGKVKEAATLHRELLPIMNGLFAAPSPSPVKAALKMYGIDVGSTRLPLVDLSDLERTTLSKIILSK